MHGVKSCVDKKAIVRALLFIFCFYPFGFLSASEDQYDKPRLAVIGFDSSNVDSGTVAAVTEFVQSRIENANLYTTIERFNIEKIFAEQVFQYQGSVDESTAIKIGKMLGAQKLLLGSLNKMGESIVITARIVNVETGEIDISATETGRMRTINMSLDRLVKKLVLKDREEYQSYLRSREFNNSIMVNTGYLLHTGSLVEIVNGSMNYNLSYRRKELLLEAGYIKVDNRCFDSNLGETVHNQIQFYPMSTVPGLTNDTYYHKLLLCRGNQDYTIAAHCIM
jgi:TolB-like protein